MASTDLSDLKPVYLIHGPEDLLLEQAVNRLKKRLAAVADLDYNLTVFDGESTGADAVIGAADTLPFMSERRLVIVRKADRLPIDQLNLIADYAQNPNPETVLVLVATKLAKNLRLYKAIDALGGAAEFKAPKKGEYPRRVVELFAERGKRIGLDAAEVLVRAVGHDLRRLSVEVDKVVAFTGEESTLSRTEIEAVMSTSAPTSVFDFIDALGDRDARGALRRLSTLLDEGQSIHGVHALSVRHIRNLLSVRALSDRGDATSPIGEIMREVGVRDWQARTLLRQAKRFEARELIDALRGAAEADEKMKTSRDARLAFELWVLAVCDA